MSLKLAIDWAIERGCACRACRELRAIKYNEMKIEMSAMALNQEEMNIIHAKPITETKRQPEST